MTIIAAVKEREGAERALPVAAELATALATDLLVLHVTTEDEYERERSRRPDYHRDDAVEEAGGVAREMASAVLGDGAEWTAKGSIGDPAAAIVEDAARADARYVVVGGRRRSPVGKATFGSVTQSVLLEATRPVVTVMREE